MRVVVQKGSASSESSLFLSCPLPSLCSILNAIGWYDCSVDRAHHLVDLSLLLRHDDEDAVQQSKRDDDVRSRRALCRRAVWARGATGRGGRASCDGVQGRL